MVPHNKSCLSVALYLFMFVFVRQLQPDSSVFDVQLLTDRLARLKGHTDPVSQAPAG